MLTAQWLRVECEDGKVEEVIWRGEEGGDAKVFLFCFAAYLCGASYKTKIVTVSVYYVTKAH
jgi:hypothetical protein